MDEERQNDTPDVEVSDAGFERRLRREIESWRAEGLIAEELADSLSARYAVPTRASDPNLLSRLASYIAIFGAALIGVGIIALLASNWDGIPDFAKISTMVVGTLASYSIGWLLAYRLSYPRTGIAVILLGAIVFGASIHLIAQAFNVEVNHPWLMPAWFVGVLPLAYVTKSRAVLVLSLILLIASTGFRAQAWFNESLVETLDDEAFVIIVTSYLGVAALLFAIGRLQARTTAFRRFGQVFDIFGILTAVCAAYILSFESLWSNLEAPTTDFLTNEYFVIATVLPVGGLLVIIATKIRFGHTDVDPARWFWEFAGVGTMLALAFGAAAALLADATWFWVPVNFIILAAVIALLFAGVRYGRASMVNIAFAVFALTVVTRYFEFGFDLLDRGVAFIITGVFLIVLGLGLERLRRWAIGDLSRRRGDA